MNILLDLEIDTESISIAETVVKSLLIDIKTTSEFFDRSEIKISSKKERIKLVVSSTDITAAKATINTCLKWLENSINIVEKFKK